LQKLILTMFPASSSAEASQKYAAEENAPSELRRLEHLCKMSNLFLKNGV